MSPQTQFLKIIDEVMEDLSGIIQDHINDGIVAKTPTEQIMIALAAYSVSAIQARPKTDRQAN